MRKLQRLSMAAVLTITLTPYAFAGIIGGMPEAPPSPQPTSASATGIIGGGPGDTQPAAAATDPVVSIALDLLQSVLLAF